MLGVKIIFLAAFLALALTELTDEQKTKLLEYGKSCLTTSGANPELIHEIKKGQFPDDANLKKFFGCMFKQTGFLNDAGEIQIDVAKSKKPKDMSQETFDKILAACNSIKGSTVDETAFMMFKCYWENSPNHETIAVL